VSARNAFEGILPAVGFRLDLRYIWFVRLLDDPARLALTFPSSPLSQMTSHSVVSSHTATRFTLGSSLGLPPRLHPFGSILSFNMDWILVVWNSVFDISLCRSPSSCASSISKKFWANTVHLGSRRERRCAARRGWGYVMMSERVDRESRHYVAVGSGGRGT
jgi:hypothetical protein